MSRTHFFATLLVLAVTVVVSPTSALGAESIEDTEPPQLLSLAVEPSEIDTTESAQSVVFTAHLTDDVSGVNSGILRVESPGGQQDAIGVFTRVSGDATDGTFEATATFSQFSELGTWEIVNVSLYDNAGNVKQLQNSDLVAEGFASSVLVGLGASEPSVDAVSPLFGPESGGTEVEIVGSGFNGATAVSFGATQAISFVVGSPTSITAISPRGSGTVDVTVSTPTATSETTPLDLFRYSPSVVLLSDLNPSVPGRAVTFTAEVTPEAQNVPAVEGTVVFMDGATTLGAASINGQGVAKFKTKSLEVGEHEIRATYSGDGYFGPGESLPLVQVVEKAATELTLKSSRNPAPFGSRATLRASLKALQPGSGTPTGTVTILEGGTPVATLDLEGKHFVSYPLESLSPGAHEFQATYSGDAVFEASESMPLTQTITP